MWDLVGNPEDRFSHNEAHLSPGKAPDWDAIPVEIYRARGLPIADLEKQQRRSLSHNDLRMYLQWKGNPQICDNRSGIYFLSIAGKSTGSHIKLTTFAS